jgi:hypothetical protein
MLRRLLPLPAFALAVVAISANIALSQEQPPPKLPARVPVVFDTSIAIRANERVLSSGEAVVSAQLPLAQWLLRFQLIEATASAVPRDPAIASVDSVLRDLFRFNGYRLISQAAMTMSAGLFVGSRGGARADSYQILGSPDGETSYDLNVALMADTTRLGAGSSATITVRLATSARTSVTRASDGTMQERRSAPQQILSTTVSVTAGKTVVLGSTQPGGTGQTLILVVRPEIRND